MPGHDRSPSAAPACAVGPTGWPAQRSNPVNPRYWPNPEVTPTGCPDCFGAEFLPVEQALAGWSSRRSCVWVCSRFPSGKFGLAEELLTANLEPEDHLKYKSSFKPCPQKEEVPLALQLANETKERSSVLAQIERERVLVKAKYEKHTETLSQLMERKYSLQREIEELEALSAAAEAKQQGVPVELLAPGPPQGHQPVGPRDVFPGPPQLIEEVLQDEEGMMRPWNQVILFLVLESVNVSLPRQLLSSDCWEKVFSQKGASRL